MSTTQYRGKFTEVQQKELLGLLWDYMRESQDKYSDRISTGWGTKTKTGLLACIESIVYPQ